jgi:hypothetical protein
VRSSWGPNRHQDRHRLRPQKYTVSKGPPPRQCGPAQRLLGVLASPRVTNGEPLTAGRIVSAARGGSNSRPLECHSVPDRSQPPTADHNLPEWLRFPPFPCVREFLAAGCLSSGPTSTRGRVHHHLIWKRGGLRRHPQEPLRADAHLGSCAPSLHADHYGCSQRQPPKWQSPLRPQTSGGAQSGG